MVDLNKTVPEDRWIQIHQIGKASLVVEFIGEKAECERVWIFIWVAVDTFWLKIYGRNANINKNMMKWKAEKEKSIG